MSTAALIVAAGRGHRAGGTIPKQYQVVAGKSVLEHTLSRFLRHPSIDRICVVINPDDRILFEAAISKTVAGGARLELVLAEGGPTRQISVLNGLEALTPLSPDHVLIHDAARPGVCADVIDRVVAGLGENQGAIAAMPVADTVKRSAGDLVETTVPRANLWAAQTPQGFQFDAILQAHRRAKSEKISDLTDDASVAEWAGVAVRIVEGTPMNTKITTQHDLEKFAMTLAPDLPRLEPRTGQGYDVHAFEPGDHVMLCGVKVPHDCGLKGHSDADVGLHALTDAILGAMGDGDIGQHFPPTDPQWEGCRSDVFLAFSRDRVAERGGRISNVDVTLVCEAPKISPHCTVMRERIADILDVTLDRISVKATTSERLGFTGRREGIAAHAIATIMLPAPDSLQINSRKAEDIMQIRNLIETAESVLEQCRSHGVMLATAESCTGGLIATCLTEVSGSSDVFERGFITYSNEAKTGMLGVRAEMIEEHGAVSELVARAMAEGALENGRAGIAVSVTGVAGPDGGSADKPVGLVHVACAREGHATVHQRCSFGDQGRKVIRELAVKTAFELIESQLGVPTVV